MNLNVYVTVRYAETDQMGVAHHASYPVWYEEARTQIIKEFGFSYSQMEEQGVLCPLSKLESKYIKPAKYEDELCINVAVSKLTPVKIEFVYKVTRKDDNELLNEGMTVHPWTSPDFKLINIKKVKPELYEIMQRVIEEKTEN